MAGVPLSWPVGVWSTPVFSSFQFAVQHGRTSMREHVPAATSPHTPVHTCARARALVSQVAATHVACWTGTAGPCQGAVATWGVCTMTRMRTHGQARMYSGVVCHYLSINVWPKYIHEAVPHYNKKQVTRSSLNSRHASEPASHDTVLDYT